MNRLAAGTWAAGAFAIAVLLSGCGADAAVSGTDPSPAASPSVTGAAPSDIEAAPTETSQPGDASPSISPEPTEPAPGPIPEAAMQASYEQESLFMANMDVFTGLGLSDDQQTALLWYKGTEEARARELAAGLEGNQWSRLEPRNWSWQELLAARKAVQTEAEALGIDVVGAAPDARGDGVVLFVADDELTPEGTLRDGVATERLTSLGLIGVKPDPLPEPRVVAGFPVDQDPAGGYFTGLPSAEVSHIAETVNSWTTRYPGLLAGVALGRWYDDVDVYFVESRRADLDRLIAEAGLDAERINFHPRQRSFQEMEDEARAMVTSPRWEEFPVMLTSLYGSAQRDGLVVGVEHLEDLEDVSEPELQWLRDHQVVAVEEVPVAEPAALANG